jgi:hypothetical protein
MSELGDKEAFSSALPVSPSALGLADIMVCFLGLGAALVVTLVVVGFFVPGLGVVTTLGVVAPPGATPFGSSFPRLGADGCVNTDFLSRWF